MKIMKVLLILLGGIVSAAYAQQDQAERSAPQWQPGINTEKFWSSYVESNGGLTWQQSTVYPDFAQVKEGDTFMIEVSQGICLMEFFHERWRRANDVRRWDGSINEYSGCPFVFD